MILTEERQIRFAHVIIDGIWGDDIVDFTDDDEALRAAKRAIAKFVAEENDIDVHVRTKLQSLKKQPVEGSVEWETMYKKYYEEEMKRR